jgi:hypothetical protein
MGEAEWRGASKVFAPRLPSSLGGADALADAVALERGESGDDGEEQPCGAIANIISAVVEV